MELLTVTCERDLPDMLLQADSINKFVQSPCRHQVIIEDESKSYDEWYNILSPYYKKHELILHWNKRPDMDFSHEFTPYKHRPDARNGIGGLGWRHQQILKMKYTAEFAKDSSVLVLDSKNFFVRPTDLENWPVKHGNGEFITFKEIEAVEQLSTIKNWAYHLRDDYNLKIPEKLAMILETPFVWQTKIVKYIWDNYDIPGMFLNPSVFPNSEFHMYFFFVDPEELIETKNKICRVMLWSPKVSYEEYISSGTLHCDQIESPTHGLHRQVRQDMTEQSIEIYEKWLTYKGLDAKLVNDYITWCR